MKRFFILMLSIIFVVWGVQGYLLLEITKIEKEIKNEKNTVENLDKMLNAKVLNYDKQYDLAKIRKEMIEKKGMSVVREIKYFEIAD